ncbi:MAG TPA: PH domain-containing protein [Opitutaceae bacterium]|nr:PH domain-containing protein [Opitutaceae bacterium]
MAPVNQEFQSAPLGGRLVATMIVVVAVIFIAITVNIGLAFTKLHAQPPGERAIVVLAPLVGLFITVPLFLFQRSRTSSFRIEENCLVFGRKRYPLEGLVEIVRDPQILRWAIRTRGESGLGAIRGRYWSRRVGKFEAFMTDPERAVVLRWPDKVVAVSPTDPEFFIHCARSAAGLR